MTFRVQVEWITCPFNRCAQIPHYGSSRAADAAFGSVGDAYAYKWTGPGLVNPGLGPVQATKAVRWAIASWYEPEPVLNLIVVPKTPKHPALQASLQHACVQSFNDISLPKGCLDLCVLSFLHDRCLQQGTLPEIAIDIVLVANAPSWHEPSFF